MKSFITNNFGNGHIFKYDNFQFNRAYPKGSFYEPVIFPHETYRLTSDLLFIEFAVDFINRTLTHKKSIDLRIVPVPELIEVLNTKLTNYTNRLNVYFDISSSDDNNLLFWEPGTASFLERLEALKLAHSYGFKTMVFCVPFYDETVINLIEQLTPFVTQFMVINTPLPFFDLPQKDIELNVSLKNKLLQLQSLCSKDFLDKLEKFVSKHSKVMFHRNHKFFYSLEKIE